MKNISLKLQEKILSETEFVLEHLAISRNKYFNEAIAFYNKLQKRRLLAEKLERESALIRENSLEILKEFEDLEDEI